jgi:ABC-2 type transport system ATP-binding protein
MADVTALCERIIIIHHGRLKYDGGINDLSHRIAPYKLIGVMLGEVRECDLGCYGPLVETDNNDGKQYIQVKAEEVTSITAQILRDLPVYDLTIEDPPIENVIERAFEE